MKKYLASLLALLFIVVLLPSMSYAAEPTVNLVINDNKVVSDVPPIIVNNRTMLPVNIVSTNLGADVNWNSKTRIVDVNKNGIHIQFNIDTKKVFVNGVQKAVDPSVTVKNDRSYLPAAFLTEQLGAKIEWKQETRTVIITDSPVAKDPVEVSDRPANEIKHVRYLNNIFTVSFQETIDKPAHFYLQNPDRIVVDIPKTALKPDQADGKLSDDLAFVPNAYIKDIRYSQYDENTVRIVADLQKASSYSVIVNDNVIQVNISHAPIPTAKRKVVYIDAGHGGSDPGAIGVNRLILEKTFNLNVANKVNAMMKNDPNVQIVLTRSGDTYPTLQQRVVMANNAKADMFISIHANAINSSTVRGIETFYYRTSSKSLADIFHNHLRAANSGSPNRGVKQASFYVIKNTTMPAILLEAGFLTNPEEEKLLASDAYQTRVAEAIVKTIDEYFGY